MRGTVEKNSEKMNRILDEGAGILWSKGYNGTSINDIIQLAGIPKGSFYFYFDSKEDFAVKAIERYFEIHFAPAEKVLTDKRYSAKKRLLNFYQFRIDMLKKELNCRMGCLASNLSSEMAEHSEKIRQTLAKFETMVRSKITTVIQEAQGTGEISVALSAKQMAAFIEDAGKGSMISMKAQANSEPLDGFLKVVKEIFLK